MKVETKQGTVVFNHCQRNSDGMYHYGEIMEAIRTQQPKLFEQLTIENKFWVSETDIKKLMKVPELKLQQQVKAARQKQDEALEIESQKISACFSSTFLGRLIDTGLTSKDAVFKELRLGDLVQSITDKINSYDATVADRDYWSVCRMNLLMSNKTARDTVYIANNKGLVEVKNAE